MRAANVVRSYPLAAGYVVAVAVALALGAADISLSSVLTILGKRLGLVDGHAVPAWQETVVITLRLPRVILASLVGAGLAGSGAVMQGMFRNALADPGVLGVSAAAAFGSVLAIYLGAGQQSAWYVPVAALVSAFAAVLVVYALAQRRQAVQGYALLLSGIALSGLFGALTSLVLSLSLADIAVGRAVMYWLLGGLESAGWPLLLGITPPLLLGLAVMATQLRELDALALGEAEAHGLGVDVAALRWRLAAATALVVGSCVAACGTVGFVGLLVPHMLRLVVGPGQRRLFPLCLVGGALFLVLADIIARTLIAPDEIQLGVVVAAVGAPVFALLLLRHARASWT